MVGSSWRGILACMNLPGIIEKYFSLRPHDFRLRFRGTRPRIPSGSTIAVIGGGIAGIVFSRILMILSDLLGHPLTIVMLDRRSCNFCAGLMTDLALQTLQRLCNLTISESVVLSRLNSIVFMNSCGCSQFNLRRPLLTMLRTGRFGIKGFDDDIRERVAEALPNLETQFTVVESASVTSMVLPEYSRGKKGIIRYSHDSREHELEADVVVIATGLRSIGSPLIEAIHRDAGYRPPPLMPASVTEMDLSGAIHNTIEDRMFIIDNIIPGKLLGLIPKEMQWLTISSLGCVITNDDLNKLFSDERMRKFVHIADPVSALKCRRICRASVFTGPARNFFGDGWVAIGDLTGLGRVLKDGYFAALKQASLAAETIFFCGPDRGSFFRHYYLPVMTNVFDNCLGMALFHLNEWARQKEFYNTMIIRSCGADTCSVEEESYMGIALRSLATGELPYGIIAVLSLLGAFKEVFTIRKG